MKVLVVTPAIRPGGGPAGYVHHWSRAVDQLSRSASAQPLVHEYEFLGARDHQRHLGLPARIPDGGVRHRVGRAVNLATRGAVRRTRGAVEHFGTAQRRARERMEHADAVVIQGFQPPSLARAARRSGARVLYMPHSPEPTAHERAMLKHAAGEAHPPWETEQFLDLEAELIDLAHCVVFPAPGAHETYERDFRADRHVLDRIDYVVSGVADPRPDVTLLGQPHPLVDRSTVLFVGRYVDHKGIDLFCEAAALVRQRTPEWKFAAFGSGPLTPSPPVVDLGWTARPHDHMNRAGLVVIANRVAYYDLLTLECAALGLPLVMTPRGGNKDQAALLPDTVLADDAEPQAIADAIVRALERRRQQPTFGARNRSSFERHFGLEQLARGWDDLLTRVAAGDVRSLSAAD